MEGQIYKRPVAQFMDRTHNVAHVTIFHCCTYALPKTTNPCFWDIHKRQTPNNAHTDQAVPANLLLVTHLSSQTALIKPAFLLSI